MRDAGLIARILAGERELFHELVRPYEKSVYYATFSILQNEQDAEDAAQETILKALKNLHTFRAESKFSTWLISIAINEARARLRHDRLLKLESVDQSPEEEDGSFTPAVITDWREVPLEALERKELRETVALRHRQFAGHLSRGAAAARCRGAQHRRDGGAAGRERGSGEDQALASAADDAEDPGAAVAIEADGVEGIVPEQGRWDMVLNCRHVWDQISNYIDGDVPPELREAIEEHLAHCRHCAAVLDSTRNILYLIADDRTFALPVGYSDRLHARLQEEIANGDAGMPPD